MSEAEAEAVAGTKEPLNSSPEDGVAAAGAAAAEGGASVTRKPTLKERMHALSVDHAPSVHPINFCLGLFGILCTCGAAGCGLFCCLGLLIAHFLPIIEIVIGAIYFKEEYCPPERLATLLIVGGSMSLLAGLIEFVGTGRKKLDERRSGKAMEEGAGGNEGVVVRVQPMWVKLLSTLLTIGSFVWLIVAAVMVYGMYGDVTYEGKGADKNYCDIVLYRFTFWVVTISLVLFPFVCCCLCAGAAGAAAGAAAVNSTNNQSQKRLQETTNEELADGAQENQ